MIAVTVEKLLTCCASRVWADLVVAQGPYTSYAELLDTSRRVWWEQTPVDEWLKAFAAHPKLGDVARLREKFGAYEKLSSSEQSALLQPGADDVLRELADWNVRYEERFGHIFILCAAGKSAAEVLAAIKQRYSNSPLKELQNAAVQQMAITELRMAAAFDAGPPPGPAVPPAAAASAAASAERRTGQLLRQLEPGLAPLAGPAYASPRSPITSHVLDTTLGRPAQGLRIQLLRATSCSRLEDNVWDVVGDDVTNSDGRATTLLEASSQVAPGTYRVAFHTGEYFRQRHAEHPSVFPAVPFYPQVNVDFTVTPAMSGQHFHIPISLNPYSYNTYRGS